MGTGSSVGVAANPRVVYADQLSKKSQEKKKYVIDTPVLVDMTHGSIRYRYTEEDKDPKNKTKRIEKPYEGKEKSQKKDYFYHPRLNDFSEKSAAGREDAHKFMYVMKGPNSAKQRKVFYVYGKGWNAKDGAITRPTASKAMGQDPAWPQRQLPNDLYYNCAFIDEAPVTASAADSSLSPEEFPRRFTLRDNETVNEVRKKIANRITKSARNIHICFRQDELSGDDVIGDLREGEDSKEDFFCVELTMMTH